MVNHFNYKMEYKFINKYEQVLKLFNTGKLALYGIDVLNSILDVDMDSKKYYKALYFSNNKITFEDPDFEIITIDPDTEYGFALMKYVYGFPNALFFNNDCYSHDENIYHLLNNRVFKPYIKNHTPLYIYNISKYKNVLLYNKLHKSKSFYTIISILKLNLDDQIDEYGNPASQNTTVLKLRELINLYGITNYVYRKRIV